MNPEEYAARQAVISAATAAYVAQFAKLFSVPSLAPSQWLQLLELLFPQILAQRQLASALAREFYDSQRLLHAPGRHDRPLEYYDFQDFVTAMDPARRKLSQENAPESAIGDLARSAVKEVENGGRRQIIHAVHTDPGPVKGWARVATGNETCGWCLMLISRGPVYLGADTAGLDLDDTSAQQMIAAGEDISEHMEEWHVGCDCKVIPVFNLKNWHGKDAADRALELWNEASTEAAKFREENPGRKHTVGKNAGKEFTLNEDAILALRRRLERGGINPSEWAGLRAA